ncbi:nucleotidyltransferase [Paenibacillus sp. y28]|uniref:nucleotidyltransferase n=1 Tax=Paenibacillus sp. y28 TaxID=3129110 RepID=UPI003015D020
MKTVGIIVEYNPLHNGHVYHFRQSRIVSGADAVVAVMSGCFLQRGEPALAGKWARAEMALRMGADLVIELPAVFACQPAEWFAYGAVSALDASGVVDSLCFGTESGDIRRLKLLAELAGREPEELTRLVKARLKEGASYPHAYAAALAHYAESALPGLTEPEQLKMQLAQPNNTLGLHYLIALQRLGSSIVPFTVARQKAGYSQAHITDDHIASATALRRILLEEGGKLEAIQQYVPPSTYRILQREIAAGQAPMHWERLAPQLIGALLSRTPQQLAELCEVNEGLEHRLQKAISLIGRTGQNDAGSSEAGYVEQLLAVLKTKRYTRTKLQRMLLHILLGHTKEQINRTTLEQGVPYLRILGFSAAGQQLLKRMRRTAKVPVLSRGAGFDHPVLQLDLRAAAMYELGCGLPRPLYSDLQQAPLQTERLPPL